MAKISIIILVIAHSKLRTIVITFLNIFQIRINIMSLKQLYYKYFLYKKIEIVTTLLFTFLLAGIIFVGFILCSIFLGTEIKNSNLLSVVGIIISAFTASLSVMKSIYENKKISDDKFFLDLLTRCHTLAFNELNKLTQNLHIVLTSGFQCADSSETPSAGSYGFGESFFNEFEKSKEFMELLGIIRCYFPHLVENFLNTIQKLKECNNYNKLSEIIFIFINTLEHEQFKYILNKNKIKFTNNKNLEEK